MIPFNVLNRIIINLYLITALLSIYMPFKTVALTCLVLFSFYFTALLMPALKQNNYYMNKYILFILISIICSALFNGNFVYVIMNLMTVSGVYYLILKENRYVIGKLSMYIILFGIVNFLLYFFIPPDYSSAKIINNILIQRVQLDILPLSITSVIALLSIILAGHLKSRILMLLICAMNILLIFKLGKLSVIITLAIFSLFVFFLLPMQRRVNNSLFKNVLKLLYTIMFLFPFLLVSFKQSLNPELLRLITFRDEIFSSYIDYTFSYGNFIFGNGFINNEGSTVLLHTNPHNQALGVFFVLGGFGLIVFLLTFLKILENTLNKARRGDTLSFKMFFAMSLMMMMDSYYVLTVFPMYMLFFIFYLIKLPPMLRLENRAGVY